MIKSQLVGQRVSGSRPDCIKELLCKWMCCRLNPSRAKCPPTGIVRKFEYVGAGGPHHLTTIQNCEGYFFDRDTAQLFDETDEASLVSSVLISNEEPTFKKIPVTGIIVLEIFLSISLIASAVAIPIFFEEDSCFILSCSHTALWLTMFGTNCYRNYQHNYIQKCGYLEFFRNTQLLQRIPLILLSVESCLSRLDGTRPSQD
ncbi:hypothetical protein AVEN_226455-1 [Araneus ventricosus]|uniref:Uncharacterized protein n=1 Tax=Araneus ventricosus TaxID=182803 RepID=A0A4Y1ZJY4_ARAVE|nr:hypothetical protein AVEN_226455-1 [Araneus ventricosus]